MTDNPNVDAVLVVDDEPDLLTLYELTLLREGYAVEVAGSVAEAWEHLLARRFRLVITDMRLPDDTGMSLLHRLEAAGRAEKVIVITAYGSADNAVEALKAGAFDYLTKPVDLRQFRGVVATAMGRGGVVSAAAAAASLAVRSTALDRLVGHSGAMCDVRAMVQKVARSMAPVLVHGESGTGKELVARAIHEVSARVGQPFVAVNCGAIPENLLEAEFFGYRKGAFTGANEDRAGFFQAAHGGTLFLDEIGDLPLAMQSKLLRVIQERAVRPVGAVGELPVNVRIVSATHKDLAVEVAAGRFRQDLFYRLNVIGITVPPLRERLEDLPELAQTLLARIAADAGTSPVTLTPEAAALLAQHSFPGNVRELENLLHRATAMSTQVQIQAEDLGLCSPVATDGASPAVSASPASRKGPSEGAAIAAVPVGPPPAAPEAPATWRSGESALAAASAAGGEGWAGAPQAPEPPVAPRPAAASAELPLDLAQHLDEVERSILVRALQEHGFNRTAAGNRLGLTLRQIRYRMARLGITPDDRSDDGAE